jgi:hypothetical protein
MHTGRFDHLTKTLSAGPRRELLRLGAALPLAGLLAALLGEERKAGAERPVDRVQRRTSQRRRARGNNNGNYNNGKSGEGDRTRPAPAVPARRSTFHRQISAALPGRCPSAEVVVPETTSATTIKGNRSAASTAA